MLRYVDVEALNFRSQPVVSAATRLAILPLGQPVEVLGSPDQAGWARISVEIDGQRRDGFVSEQFLREPVSDAREALIATAVREWLRFEKGLGKEFTDPFAGFVGEMWRALGLDLDGRDRDVPWSAAAISFMVRHAGERFAGYRTFRFAAAHARYVHDAIVRRDAGDDSAPFWGHCDIIVRITADDVLAIGGNVAQSVSITRYQLTPSGFLADADQVFAHLVNRV